MDNPKDIKEYIDRLEVKQALIKEKLKGLKIKCQDSGSNIIRLELNELKTRFEKLEQENIDLYNKVEEIMYKINV